MNALARQIPLQFPVKLQPIFQPRRFKVMHGGRGGGKSHTIAQVLIAMSMRSKLRILCVREVQKSLTDSVWQLLLDYIERFGLQDCFKIVKSESRIECLVTGSTFGFSGLKDHNATSLKSWESCDICWVEEAHAVSAYSWNVLIPTIRKAGSEIWLAMNPDQETDYAYDRFIKNNDPDAWVCQINWRDNPWFGDEMNTERRKLKAINDDLYMHVYEGKCRSIAGLLFKRNWFKRYKLGAHPSRMHFYLSSDYAGGPDPEDPDADPDFTEHGCAGMDHNGEMWFVDWWSGQEDPDVWIKAWLAMVKRWKPLRAFEEKGPILRAVDGSITKAMREAKTFTNRTALASAGNKAARALGFAARAAAGTVWIPEGEWGDRLVNQLCAFNGQEGKIDDMVDVCSLLARGLDDMVNGLLPEEKKPDPPAPFTEAYWDAKDRMDRAEVEDRRLLR